MSDLRQPDDKGEAVEPSREIVPVDEEFSNHELVSWSDRSGDAAASAAQAGGAGTIAKLLRYKWSILLVFLLIAGAGVPAVYFNVQPTYKSTAIVRVSPVVPKIVWQTENTVLPVYYRHLNTQVSIIQSQAVLRPVLRRDDVRQSAWYARVADPSGEVTDAQLDALIQALQVQLRKDSELIDVSVTGDDPNSCTVLANAIVSEFEKYNHQQLRAEDVALIEQIARAEEQLGVQIKNKLRERDAISQALGTDTPAELRSNLMLRLSGLEAEYDKLERQHRMTLWELERARSGAQASTSGAGTPSAFAFDSEWYRLSMNLQQARAERDAAKERYGPAHPEMQKRQRMVDVCEQLLAAREQQLRSGVVVNSGAAVSDPAALAKMVEQQERELELRKSGIEKLRSQISDTSKMAGQIEQYDNDLALLRKQFDDVRSRRKQLETEGKAPARITVADYAIEPLQPYESKRKKIAIVVVGAAFMLSIGLAYMRSRLDHRILEVSDVRLPGRAPFLGQLPAIPRDGSGKLGSNPAFMECVRMIRTALLERLGSKTRQIILITSSTEQTGKTTLASLLARSFAVLGKRTLLVEADLRKPALSQHFDTASSVGLTALLQGTATDEQAIVSTPLRNLDVVFAGAIPTDFNPELLANGVFSSCLSRWRSRYDLILLDSPPVLPVADSRILATQADGAVMVLRASHTKRPDAIRAYADLSASGGTLLGSVLVGVPSGNGYGYRGYGSDSGYAAALPGNETGLTPKD